MRTTLVALLLLAACTNEATTTPPRPPRTNELEVRRITAAKKLTEIYGKSRLESWKVDAKAAGPRCGILLVEIGIILDESLVEAMHYGAGAYDVVPGGVQSFYRERSFHAVAYKDSSARMWTFGGIGAPEAEGIETCH